MKAYLSVVAGLMVLLGTGWLLFPEAMLAAWAVRSDGVGVYLGRRYGGLLFGYAAILWMCRNAGPSMARAAILGGGWIVTTLVALISLWGVVAGTIGPGGWTAAAIEAVLSGGFLYYFLAERRLVRPAP